MTLPVAPKYHGPAMTSSSEYSDRSKWNSFFGEVIGLCDRHAFCVYPTVSYLEPSARFTQNFEWTFLKPCRLRLYD